MRGQAMVARTLHAIAGVFENMGSHSDEIMRTEIAWSARDALRTASIRKQRLETSDPYQRPPLVETGVDLVENDGRIVLGSNVHIRRHAMLDCGKGGHIEIGANSVIMPYAVMLAYGGRIRLGEYCSVNPFCVLHGHGGLTIGNYVRIAPGTVVIPANHIYDDPDRPISRQGLDKKGVVIEDDVWIGAGAIILDGVHIGKGAVIGAGAVVNKDVASMQVVAGVPARQIAMRGKETVLDAD